MEVRRHRRHLEHGVTHANYHRVCAVRGMIYVAEGRDASKVLRSMLRYDPSSDTWTAIASILQFSLAVFALDGCVKAASCFDGID
jgi:hypothetical protein